MYRTFNFCFLTGSQYWPCTTEKEFLVFQMPSLKNPFLDIWCRKPQWLTTETWGIVRKKNIHSNLRWRKPTYSCNVKPRMPEIIRESWRMLWRSWAQNLVILSQTRNNDLWLLKIYTSRLHYEEHWTIASNQKYARSIRLLCSQKNKSRSRKMVNMDCMFEG